VVGAAAAGGGALALINQTLDEAPAEQEGDVDADSRWALAWFEQSGFAEGEYGAAEALSYNGLVQSWPEITRLAREGGKARAEQGGLFE
jgi:putative DNA methylase